MNDDIRPIRKSSAPSLMAYKMRILSARQLKESVFILTNQRKRFLPVCCERGERVYWVLVEFNMNR